MVVVGTEREGVPVAVDVEDVEAVVDAVDVGTERGGVLLGAVDVEDAVPASMWLMPLPSLPSARLLQEPSRHQKFQTARAPLDCEREMVIARVFI